MEEGKERGMGERKEGWRRKGEREEEGREERREERKRKAHSLVYCHSRELISLATEPGWLILSPVRGRDRSLSKKLWCISSSVRGPSEISSVS